MPKTRPAPREFEPDWLQRSLERYYVVGLVFMVVLIAAFPLYRIRESQLRKDAKTSQLASSVSDGNALFQKNCSGCHGTNATGGGEGPTLNSKGFLTGTTDAQAALLITGGVSGSQMSAWSIDYGGSLTDQQINDLVAYLRSLAPTAPDIAKWRSGAKS
jgi:ubiquinol-cytochrome c reductase cytochrome c subunit